MILTKTNQSISSWCHDSVANSYAGGCRTPTRATKAITVQLGLKYVHRNGKYRNLNAFSKTILTHRKIRIPPFLKSILFFKAYVRKAFSNCAKSDALGYMRNVSKEGWEITDLENPFSFLNNWTVQFDGLYVSKYQ